MSLKFKGDKVKKKKRSHRDIEDPEDRGEGSSTGASAVRARYGKDAEGWILLLSEADLVGPTFLTSKQNPIDEERPLALCSNPINNKVYPFVLPQDMDAESAEPTQIDAIWRCARVPESEDKVTFKSAQDRYLACDHVGSVSAQREARGAEEEFMLVAAPEEYGKGSFAIRSAAYGTYLSIDEVAGGKLELRGDVESVGKDEVWFVKMQAEFLGSLEEERRKKQKKQTADPGLTIIGDLKSAENANILKYQARGAGRIVSSSATKKELAQAMKDGRLAEEMLDRRMKLKSDKFC